MVSINLNSSTWAAINQHRHFCVNVICAVGPSCYSLGDTDVPRGKRRGLYKKLGEIDARYGSRDHLRYQIAEHLASIGRYIDAPPKEEEAWIDNETPELAEVTPYDVAHFQTYAVLLMSEEMGLDWRKMSRAILNIDPEPPKVRSSPSAQRHHKDGVEQRNESYILMMPRRPGRGDLVPDLAPAGTGPSGLDIPSGAGAVASDERVRAASERSVWNSRPG